LSRRTQHLPDPRRGRDRSLQTMCMKQNLIYS